MTHAITIKTRLNSGIYKSNGGGETRTHYSYAVGPRNLLKAIDQLHAHRKEMRNGYGNIGCGMSWLEIDGVEVDDYELNEVEADDSKRYKDCMFVKIESRTDKARQLIARVQSAG